MTVKLTAITDVKTAKQLCVCQRVGGRLKSLALNVEWKLLRRHKFGFVELFNMCISTPLVKGEMSRSGRGDSIKYVELIESLHHLRWSPSLWQGKQTNSNLLEENKKDDRPCILDSRLFVIWEKIIMNWFVTWFSSQYIKNFCTMGNRDWCYTLWKRKGKICWGLENPPHRNCKQTKGRFCSALRCEAH